MNGFKWLAVILLLGSLAVASNGQSKEHLESQRKKIIKEIEKTSQFLEKTKQNKATTIKDLKVIESQVDNRKKLISTIKQEIQRSDVSLKTNAKKIDSLTKQLNLLNQNYNNVLRYEYKQQLSNNKWMYLLSANSINNFLLRWRYLTQFEDFCAKKKKEIAVLNADIAASNQSINQTLTERKTLLTDEESHYSLLETDLQKKNQILKEISSKESALKAELETKKREREKLNLAIEQVILASLRAAQAKEKEKAKKSPVAATEFSTKMDKLSSDFQQNKNKLPWPVGKGSVSSKFGTQPHPTLKGVQINNNGIDIVCPGNQTVKSVFEGEVVGITRVLGSNNMVIVKHGMYYSVYSNLTNVNVRKGDVIKTQDTIGSVGPNDEGLVEIHFELWKEDKTKLNPEQWLK